MKVWQGCHTFLNHLLALPQRWHLLLPSPSAAVKPHQCQACSSLEEGFHGGPAASWEPNWGLRRAPCAATAVLPLADCWIKTPWRAGGQGSRVAAQHTEPEVSSLWWRAAQPSLSVSLYELWLMPWAAQSATQLKTQKLMCQRKLRSEKDKVLFGIIKDHFFVFCFTDSLKQPGLLFQLDSWTKAHLPFLIWTSVN